MPSRARQPELFDTQRTQVVNRTHRRMRLARFTIGGTGERHAHPTFAEVREHAAVKDLVVGMGQYDQERRTADPSHDTASRNS